MDVRDCAIITSRGGWGGGVGKAEGAAGIGENHTHREGDSM